MAKEEVLFNKGNYILLISGLFIVIVGFVMMGAHFNLTSQNKIYSFSKITLSPIHIISGYIVLIFAIFKK